MHEIVSKILNERHEFGYPYSRAAIISYNQWLQETRDGKPTLTLFPVSLTYTSHYPRLSKLRSTFSKSSETLEMFPELVGSISAGLACLKRKYSGGKSFFSVDAFDFASEYYKAWLELFPKVGRLTHTSKYGLRRHGHIIYADTFDELKFIMGYLEGFPIEVTYHKFCQEYEGGFIFRIKLTKGSPVDDDHLKELTAGVGGCYYTNNYDLTLLLKIMGHKVWTSRKDEYNV